MPVSRFFNAGSVRTRTTVSAVLVVGAALVIASLTLVWFLHRNLTEDTRTTARFRAVTVVELLASESDVETIGDPGDEDEFVQVLDSTGQVVFSSANIEGRPVVARLLPGESTEVTVPIDDNPFLVTAFGGVNEGEVYRILVGRNLDTVEESGRVVVSFLIAGLPLLLLLVGAVTWRLVGRALAPVEAIRSEVDSISTKELHRRVPIPASQDEIARLAATMNQMLERLDTGQARQRRFVSDASHELRNPVATIRQHAEVALAHPGTASAEELAEVVLTEDLRLQRLVEDLLMLAKMDEGTSGSRKEPVDLDDIVFQEVDRARRSTEVPIDTGRVSGGRVDGDARQLSRLVGNLLENALRHAKGLVTVGLATESNGVVLHVEDDGAGISLGDRDKVFERFVRLEEARDRDSGGSGLGLAIVAEVASAHGASVSVTESPQGGARFDVRFPPDDD